MEQASSVTVFLGGGFSIVGLAQAQSTEGFVVVRYISQHEHT